MELTKDTQYNLEMRLQRIDEQMARFTTGTARSSDISIDLEDERAVTQKCLRICEDAKAFIESLTNQESSLLQEAPKNAAGELIRKAFDAQLETRQALGGNRDKLAETIGRLQQRLETLLLEGDPDNNKERMQLQEDINISKQCLELCKVAAEVSQQKIHIVREALADDNSDQVVVTTVADLFDVGKAVSTRHSAQVVGSMTPENFRDLTEKRYNSRILASVPDSSPTEAGASRSPSVPETLRRAGKSTPQATSNEDTTQGQRTSRAKPSPNEMRKRFTKDDVDE
jgi:hypothetical protein